MKRRAGIVGVVGTMSVAIVLAVAWRAWGVSDDQAFKAPCTYCTFIVPFPAGYFHMIR